MKLLSGLPAGALSGKRVLLRVDFNVPIKSGIVQDDTRIRETVPTIKRITGDGANVCICSHLGKPDGRPDMKYSLAPVAKRLAELLGEDVHFIHNIFEDKWRSGKKVALLENTRFFPEEEENGSLLAAILAKDCDMFVNDAFGAAHRAHASTAAVAGFLPHVAGLLLEKEVTILQKIIENPQHPVVLIVGGAKMKTKIGILEKFTEIADTILVGGGIANTMLAAKGFAIGESLYENDEMKTAENISIAAQKKYCNIIIPEDAVVAKGPTDIASVRTTAVSDVRPQEKIFDIGPKTIKKFTDKIATAKTVIWNGPVGLSEEVAFSEGTRALLAGIKECPGETVLGGGDTLDAIARLGFLPADFTHLSTGGGAMLEFLEGKILPAVATLE